MVTLVVDDASNAGRREPRAVTPLGLRAVDDETREENQLEADRPDTAPVNVTASPLGAEPVGTPVSAPDQRQRSLEMKLVLSCVAGALIALIMAFSAFNWFSWRSDCAALIEEQIALGGMIAPQAAMAGSPGDLGNLATATAAALARGNPHTTDVVWFPARGGSVPIIVPTGARAALKPGGALLPTSYFGVGGVVVRIPNFADGRRTGELVMRAHQKEIEENLLRNNTTALILAAVATGFAAVGTGFLVNQALQPLRTLERGIETVRLSRDFSYRVDVASNDELGRLTAGFNDLLTDLEMYDFDLTASLRQLAASRDEAEAANRSKAQFLANMSHEIRTPLNGVLGVASALSKTDLSSPQREMVDLIDVSGRTLETLVSDLLDFARIDSGKLELSSEPFDLARIVNACSLLFSSNAAQKHLDFRVEIAPDLTGTYLGDAQRIRQILLNLLSNAVKFTAEGSVLLSVGGQASDQGAFLTFEVKDTGIGFDEETGNRLFKRFEQADGSITRKYGGTGLGLAISRSLAVAMGGTLEATSDPGKGAAFTLSLYCPRAEETETPPEPCVADPEVEITRVLVAEDHPTNRKVAELILTSFGVDAIFAENGAEAVEAWRHAPFDLVLMDMQMPIMDGLTAIREIRLIEEREGRARTPVWTLSANALPEHAQASYAAGSDGHETKPVTSEKLLAVLTAAAGERVVQ